MNGYPKWKMNGYPKWKMNGYPKWKMNGLRCPNITNGKLMVKGVPMFKHFRMFYRIQNSIYEKEKF